jgi:hypothetical protein
MAAPMPDSAAYPYPRQFPVHVSTHGIADGLDFLRDDLVAPFTQVGCIGSKCGQRRLEPMGEIGCPAARTLNLPLLAIEQRIDLLDQRLDLRRDLGRQVMAAPRSNMNQWLSLEALQNKVEEVGFNVQSGFKVQKAKLKNSCAEFYVAAKTGERMELFVDPATGTIIGGQ